MPDWTPPTPGLSERLQDSRRWFQSEGREGAPFVAHHEDLSGIDLAEQTLVEAQLQGANLRGSRLDSALLMRASLDGADLTGAFLYQADLSRTSATETRMDHVEAPRSRWVRASLVRSSLVRANLHGSYAAGLEALRCDLTAAVFDNAELRGASFLGSDLEGLGLAAARVDGLVVDAGAIGRVTGLEQALGEWVAVTVPNVGPPVAKRDSESDWELEVGRRLRSLKRVRALHQGFRAVDFVAEISRHFLAIEATTARDRNALLRKTAHADLVITPEGQPTRSFPDPSKLAHLDDLDRRLRDLDGSSGLGAYAILERQASRLRPYFDVLQRVREDPSALSRLSVYLDSRQPLMLTSADRPVAETLPAHLDGEMLGRAIRWLEHDGSQVREVLDSAEAVRSGAGLSPARANRLARSALDLERELADAARSL